MRRITIILSVFMLAVSATKGQTALTLEECRQKAVDNYPLIRQYDLISLSEQYSLSNVSKSYLPQVSLNGQASYQSHVTKLPVDLSSLPLPNPIENPTMDKDQYKATIDVSQTLWDGGATSSQRKVTKANSEVEKKQVEVNLYAVKEKVNQLYFGILAIDENLKMIDLVESDMQTNKDIAQSMVKNGVAMQSDLDQIDVELLNIEQSRTEQLSLRSAYIKMLGMFIHQELPGNVKLLTPDKGELLSTTISRPELTLYDSQRSLLDAQESNISAKNMPKFGLFAQAGYGKPGLNMLENKFKLFAIGGIKLTWNFGNLYTKSNEYKLINNNRNNIDIQRETFLFNTNIQLTQEQAEIQKISKMLTKDDEIIQLRNRVKKASESKYKNGVYQTNELIRDINAENQARQTKALRQVQYLMSIYNYKHIQGN